MKPVILNEENKLIKTIPNVLFILFMFMLALVFIKFVPGFIIKVNSMKLYKEKTKIKYFSEYFSDEPSIVKVFDIFIKLIIALFLIMFGIKFGFYCSLVNQRISVPELNKQKTINNIIFYSSLISIISLIALTFFGQKTLYFTKRFLHLSDNVFFLIFLISLYTICSNSIRILNSLELSGIKKDQFYMLIKNTLLAFMTISLYTYSVNLLVISYYTPYINIEKFFTSIFIICKEITSIMFLLFFSIFALTFKYDFYFLKLNLVIRPDVEYFLDVSDLNIKSV